MNGVAVNHRPSSGGLLAVLQVCMPLFRLVLLGLAIMGLSRLGLVVWQWERVTAATSLPVMLLQGLRADLIMMGMLIAPLALLMPVLANRFSWPVWRGVVLLWSVASLTLLVFMEVATPQFIMEYDVRPDRLFVEYLQYPKEVSAMLWNGFRLPLLLGVGVTALAGWLAMRLMTRTLAGYRLHCPQWQIWLMWPLLVIVIVMMVRSTLGHRPANPALFARSSDALVNSLFINSAWSVYYAVYNMKHESKTAEMYGKLDTDEILASLHEVYPWIGTDAQSDIPTLRVQTASVKRDKLLNLVIILQESLGAEYVASLGGLPVTPNLDSLRNEGWWFEQLYATGTRSVRGIEAVISGYLPTPAPSVVKLSRSQNNFFTLASLLGSQGYFTEFVYGGESHFDNMASFFIGNGFQSVIDQRDYDSPVFLGSWGVSDEDLLNKTHERISELHSRDQPFLSFVFTSSNHSPFEFPDGRIELHDPVKQSAVNAVKYADHALGRFIEEARNSDYWDDTLFLIVADHSSRASGDNLVPIEDFQIPGLILGADLAPKQIDTLASQIDLAPTLLSLMGISAAHPMIGRDLTDDAELQQPGRALMQFSDYIALMQGRDVTILRPDQPALSGVYDRVAKQLQLQGEAGPEAQRRALAHVLLPSWLYREQRYQLPSQPQTQLSSRAPRERAAN